MSRPVRLSHTNCDVSRFFNNTTYSRSIKLWVNGVSFTCSRLILAKHSAVFEHHLRDSPPSLLLEDFEGEEGVEESIQDALLLMYGGAVVITPRNISVIARFATLYNVEELLNSVMEWVNSHLTVENVMPLFTALRTVEPDGTVNLPEVIRRFMERNTGPIVDHLLSSPSQPENDDFLLSMLELPSSSVLVQKCLKAGNLPDPIVDLIFKNSSTINVNFLLHDDKRTYVRLISILKSKARTYADMERIIDIQQKCIAKMVRSGGSNPYGSFDSIAPGNLVTAPSLATVVAGPPKHISGVHRSPHRTSEEYFPRQEEQRGGVAEDEEGEYLEPEEVKMFRKSRGPSRENTVRNGRAGLMLPSSQRGGAPRESGGMVTSRDPIMTSRDPVMTSREHAAARNAKMPPAVVAQLKNNLEKKKGPPADHHRLNDVDRTMGRLNLTNHNRGITSPPAEPAEPPKSPPAATLPPTKYAEVYMKRPKEGKEVKEGKEGKGEAAAAVVRGELREQDSEERRDHNTEALREATETMNRQSEMIAEALSKLADQQAFIEHTYDNMSILSGGRGGSQSPPTIPRNPDLAPTTFASRAPSSRSLQRSIIPPEPPSEPPPGATFYPRPGPVLTVPPPPPPEPEVNLEELSAIDFGGELPRPRVDFEAEVEQQLQQQQRGRAKIAIPDLRVDPGSGASSAPAMSKEELLRHSHVLINKRTKSRSRERTKERASMKKKKVSEPVTSAAATLRSPTEGRPKKSKRHPPTRAVPAAAAANGSQRPYHIKYIPSKIPGNDLADFPLV